MLSTIDTVAATLDVIAEMVAMLDVRREHMKPVEFVEKFRVMTRAETQSPGPIDLSITPYFKKPLNQMDPFDPAREIIILKGVKTAYTTAVLESAAMYFMAFLGVYPMMFVSADKELAQSRVKTNFIPMLNNSGFGNIFKTVDENSAQKSGKTNHELQFLGGGNLVIEGAKNADKMRMYAPLCMLIDEFAAFMGQKRDGDTMQLLFDRCQGFWDMRKILMGTTPTLKGGYPDREFLRGNQQQYMCRCLKCGYPQWLKFGAKDINDKSTPRGMRWDYNVEGQFDPLTIRYECHNCAHAHTEQDKARFISDDNSYWEATATPSEAGIESYSVPGALSRLNPWSKLVGDWHKAYTKDKKLKSVQALQVFYNNVLGASFQAEISRVNFRDVSGHRRMFYVKGDIPNNQIAEYCESHVMFVCMTVDVGDHYLNVAVWGVTIGGNTWLIDYKKLSDESEAGCTVIESHTWGEVQRLIDEQEYTANDGKKYWIEITLVDSGDGGNEALVVDFCNQWEYGVYPIKGDSYSSKRLSSFREFKTSIGSTGYMIAVDHYKDRLAPVLRRRWSPELGDQGRYHFNAPLDTSDDEIKELSAEYKREKVNSAGNVTTEWHRPKGRANELWDLLVYANAAIEILAYMTCIGNLGLKEINWPEFWNVCEGDQPLFYENPKQ